MLPLHSGGRPGKSVLATALRQLQLRYARKARALARRLHAWRFVALLAAALGAVALLYWRARAGPAGEGPHPAM